MAAVQSGTEGNAIVVEGATTTLESPRRQPEVVDVLVYSDDRTTRRAVIESVGRRAGKGLPLVRWTETATHAAVLEKVSETDFAVLVLDGESAKVGGMAISRELKTSLYRCPRVIVTIARPQDAWLATWSEADAVVAEPLDPVDMQETLAGLLRDALADAA